MNIEEVEELAILNLKKDGHLCGAILFDEPHRAIIPMIYVNDEQKRHFRSYVRKLFNEMKVTHYFVVTETWISSNPHIDTPALDINRKEAIMIAEYSTENINGKVIIRIFSRSGKDIIFSERIANETNAYIDRLNFFKEELTNEEIDEIKKREAVSDLVKRIEQADLKEEYNEFLERFPDAKSTYEEFKRMFVKLVTDEKVTFRDGKIPKKFRLPTDDIEEELSDG